MLDVEATMMGRQLALLVAFMSWWGISCSDTGRLPFAHDLRFTDDMGSADSTPTVDVTSPDVDPAMCKFDSDGTLKGVSIDLSGNGCVYSLAQAAQGITFHYRVQVEQELTEVISRPMDAGQCDEAGPSGLRTFEKIFGNDQTYCVCDAGLCKLPTEGITLVPGDYPDAFTWHGRNWNGPSDTGNPEGQPFPTGEYTLVVRAEGNHGPLKSDFAVTATMKVILVP
jgi:hypothetical protein